MLYVPGDREAMLAKAATRGADALILNLEDAVAPDRKDLARQAVATALRTIDLAAAEVVVRVNPPDTDAGYRDLLAITPLGPDAILLPKTRTPEEARFAAWTVERLESLHGVAPGQVKIMCMVESAAGILAARAIATSHPRVAALLFGAADFCAEVGCVLMADGRPSSAVLHAASQLVLAARSAGIDAIDAPHMKIDDAEGLARSTTLAWELGFNGKSAIHPSQIAAINAAFSPNPEEIAWAGRVVTALRAEDSSLSLGAALLDGQLVEAPHLARARRILTLAERLGLLG
jgi:citrate lyase subunit beta/citryl-CoA lyase